MSLANYSQCLLIRLKKMAKGLIFRSHAPAWECIPYGLPRRSMGTMQELTPKKCKLTNEGCLCCS